MSMFIPFNDTSRLYQAHKAELQSSLIKTAESGHWLLGKETENFAQSFSKYCDVKYCLPVANGTDALEIALRSTIQNPNLDDEVITVANAGGYTTAACRTIGVTPVYADINKKSHLIDTESLLRCISPSVKAIVITHLYGAAVNVSEVRKKLTEINFQHIPIIEDCAQAHGAKVNNDRVGSLGDVATFSFYPTKNLGALGDGGAITTSDPEIYKKAQQLHQYGWNSKYNVGISYGRNSRMDEIQAGILNCLLPHLDLYNKKRIQIIERYKQAEGGNLSFLDYSDRDYVGHLAIVTVKHRDAFIEFMRSKNISVDVHYPIADCDQKAWKNSSQRWDETSNLKITREVTKTIVSLPCFPFLKEKEIVHVYNALSEWQSN
ncbi:MAG: DegT/DnrJ/EryC1/StrS family aminotransferase [Gammaproteobacteria bacterium]